MLAFITGASSGIGRDMARYLYKLGYDIIITARNEEAMQMLKQELEQLRKGKVYIISADLSEEQEVMQLYETIKKQFKKVDIVVNNAGFGLFGRFVQTDLETEINMIHTNIIAVHTLTKLFLQDMLNNNEGKILNVSSVAGFMPGPLMATYYSTKNYVFRLSEAIHKELKKMNSKVQISVLCPGPVKTNFNEVAHVKFNLREASSEKIAKYAIDKMLQGKFKIIPVWDIKIARLGSKILPDNILAEICYHMQERKEKK